MIHHAVVTVQLARSDFTVEEGSGSVAVQLTKSGQTASPFSVILTTANGSAEGKGLSGSTCNIVSGNLGLCVVSGLVISSDQKYFTSLLYRPGDVELADQPNCFPDAYISFDHARSLWVYMYIYLYIYPHIYHCMQLLMTTYIRWEEYGPPLLPLTT